MSDIAADINAELEAVFAGITESEWEQTPVSFAQFVTSAEHMNFPPLSPKQMEAALAILGENPLELFDAIRRKYNVSCCLWGKGSLSEDELLADAKTGVERTVAEWAELKRPINVRTYDTTSKAIKTVAIDAPVLEDVGDILQIFTDNRENVQVNTEHKFLGVKGNWVRAGDIQPNDILGSTMGLPMLMDMKSVRVTGVRKLPPRRFYGLTVDPYGNYIHQNLIHKNSGKDSLAALMVCYVVYVLLCLKDPNKHLTGHHIADEPIDIVNVAYSADQANNVFFAKLRSRVKNWKWLRKKYKMRQSGRLLEAKEKSKFQEDVGNDTVTVYPTIIMFPHMIRAFSRHSLSESTEGLNVLFFILDEASAMKDDTQKANADKLYQMLRSSANSRFPKKWFGMILSWPRHKGDFTMRMYADAQRGLLPDVFASKGATWEINPTKTRDDFKAELENPATATDATAMYECNPPQQIQGFFDFPDKISPCVSTRPQIAEFNVTYNTAPTGAVLIGKVLSKYNISRQPDNKRYVARVDLGETRDMATLAIGHLEGVMVVIDLLTHWSADRASRTPIDVDDPANIIIQLRENLIPITHCTYDQWNSASSINRLNKVNILTAKVGLNLEDYKLFRSCVYSRTIDLLDYPLLTDPATGELANLRLFNGNKVDHDACFTGDTKVALLDGRDLTFLQLIEEYKQAKELWTYSVDIEKQRIVPKRIINPHWTKSDVVYKVVLDNGEIIRCTGEHLFMLRDGTYQSAKDLKTGTSLMPLYRKFPEKGGLADYELLYSPFEDKWHFTHQQFCGISKRKRGYVIHHIDINRRNNNPSNLQYLTVGEHRAIHNRRQTAEERKKRKDSIQRWHTDLTPEKRALRRTQIIDGLSKAVHHQARLKTAAIKKLINFLIKLMNIKSGNFVLKGRGWCPTTVSDTLRVAHIKNPEWGRKCGDILRRNNAIRWEAYRKNNYVETICVCGCGEVFNKKKTSVKRFAHRSHYFNTPESKFPNALRKRGAASVKNHKVVSVEMCGVEDVYDLEIEGTHNFALASGVFVHNSHTNDLSEAVCGVVAMLVGSRKNIDNMKGAEEGLYRDNERSAMGDIWTPEQDGVFSGNPMSGGDPFGVDGLQGVSAKFHKGA